MGETMNSIPKDVKKLRICGSYGNFPKPKNVQYGSYGFDQLEELHIGFYSYTETPVVRFSGRRDEERNDGLDMPNLKRIIADSAAYYYVEHVTFEGAFFAEKGVWL